jgi:hypothetical protein
MNSEWRCLIAYDVALNHTVTKSTEDMDLIVFTDERLHSFPTILEVSLFFSVIDVWD